MHLQLLNPNPAQIISLNFGEFHESLPRAGSISNEKKTGFLSLRNHRVSPAYSLGLSLPSQNHPESVTLHPNFS